MVCPKEGGALAVWERGKSACLQYVPPPTFAACPLPGPPQK